MTNTTEIDRYSRNPHPAQNTIQERKTNTKDGMVHKTAQVESQKYSSFPVDGHQVILNKENKKSKVKQKADNQRQLV